MGRPARRRGASRRPRGRPAALRRRRRAGPTRGSCRASSAMRCGPGSSTRRPSSSTARARPRRPRRRDRRRGRRRADPAVDDADRVRGAARLRRGLGRGRRRARGDRGLSRRGAAGRRPGPARDARALEQRPRGCPRPARQRRSRRRSAGERRGCGLARRSGRPRPRSGATAFSRSARRWRPLLLAGWLLLRWFRDRRVRRRPLRRPRGLSIVGGSHGESAAASRALPARRCRLLVASRPWLLALVGNPRPGPGTVARGRRRRPRAHHGATYTIVPAKPRRPGRHRPDRPQRQAERRRRAGRHAVLLRRRPTRDPGRGRERPGHVRRAAADDHAQAGRRLPRCSRSRFRASLFFRQSTTVRITFDLPGGAPRSESNIRVGTAFATFVAWAFGDSGSVRIVVPAGFEAETTGSDAARSRRAPARRSSRRPASPTSADWYVVVNADRKSALTSERIDLAGGEHVVDPGAGPRTPTWRTQVSDLLTTRPARARRADSASTGRSRATCRSSRFTRPLLEGYAGVFFQDQDKIEISEDLDDLTILHEASHAWFNGDLFDGPLDQRGPRRHVRRPGPRRARRRAGQPDNRRPDRRGRGPPGRLDASRAGSPTRDATPASSTATKRRGP